MDNLFTPIDGVIVKLVKQETKVLELSEDAQPKNIGEIISDKSIIQSNIANKNSINFNIATPIKLTSQEYKQLSEVTEMIEIGHKQNFLKPFSEKVKIRFTDGYPLNDLGKDIYYVKLVDIIGIYN